MRVLIEQSGYDLLNIGDVAMLQGLVVRVRRHAPASEISVVGYDAQALERYVPGAQLVGPQWVERRLLRRTSRRSRIAFEQAYKTLVPLLPATVQAPFRPPRHGVSMRRAVAGADVVIAAGGGYICDTFWWHGAGILAALDYAQRLGKPTAMFGQGIGPLRHPLLRHLAARVLGRLDMLGLREGETGLSLLQELSALRVDGKGGFVTRQGGRVMVTGDDAFEIIRGIDLRDERPRDRGAPLFGINLRVSGYAGTGAAEESRFASVVADIAAGRSARMVALPISRYAADGDSDAVARMFRNSAPDGAPVAIPEAVDTPARVAEVARECDVVITGSYHAAVIALAVGVPVVAISASSYYDAKFLGLKALFPEMTSVVGLSGENFARDLRHAVAAALQADAEKRGRGVARAHEFADVGSELVRGFLQVEGVGVSKREAASRFRVTGSPGRS